MAMKILILPFLFLFVQQNPTQCEFVKDSDQRNYCKAVTTGKKHWCFAIKDADLRNRCRALVGGNFSF